MCSCLGNVVVVGTQNVCVCATERGAEWQASLPTPLTRQGVSSFSIERQMKSAPLAGPSLHVFTSICQKIKRYRLCSTERPFLIASSIKPDDRQKISTLLAIVGLRQDSERVSVRFGFVF